ncbi:MAG: hypothetical protein ACK5MT_18090 [Actinomycetales bacterium]
MNSTPKSARLSSTNATITSRGGPAPPRRKLTASADRYHPSIEAVIRLADIFDVSCLLLDDAPRRPLRGDNPLAERLADLDNLTDTDRAALIHILDSLLANTRIRAPLNNAG